MSCASGCMLRGRHLGSCSCGADGHEHVAPFVDDDGLEHEGCLDCTGCLPAMEAPGKAVCGRCTDRATGALSGDPARHIASLDQIWLDLAERARLSGVSRTPEGGERKEVLAGERVQTRSSLRALLVAWTEILRDKHGISAPAEDDFARSTRTIAVHKSGLAHQARTLSYLLAQPNNALLHQDLDASEKARKLHGSLSQSAENARADRQSGYDVIRGLAAHIGRHLDRLLADPDDAPTLVEELTAASRHAARLANPSRGAKLRIRCNCGVQVPVDSDEVMTCPGCGEWGTLNWWVEHRAPEVPDPMALSELPAWLAMQGVIVSHRYLRDLADKGKLTPVSGGGGKLRRYDPQAALLVTQTAVAEGRKTRARRVA